MALINRPSRKYEDDEKGKARKRRKVAPKRVRTTNGSDTSLILAQKVELMSSVKGQALSTQDIESTLLRGMTFCEPQ